MYSLQSTKSKSIISPVSRTAGHTQVGFQDCRAGDEWLVLANCSDIATVGTASATGGSISLGEADDTNVSNATTIVADRTALKIGRLIAYHVDTRLMKQYGHVTATAGTAGVSNETQLFSVTGTVGRLRAAPTSTGGMVEGLTNSVAVLVVG